MASHQSWRKTAGRCPVVKSHKMSEEPHSVSGYPKRGHSHSYITAENDFVSLLGRAAGIGIMIVILGILLLIGCWYCRWRRGYWRMKDTSFHGGPLSALRGRCSCEVFGYQNKLPLQENNYETVVPNAPPAYEKVSVDQSPPPYSP